METLNGSFRVRVESAAEYNNAAKHADALGFEASNFAFHGCWESSKSEGELPVFLGGQDVHVETVGRTLFHAEVDGNIEGVKPGDSSSQRDPGSVTVTFAAKDD